MSKLKCTLTSSSLLLALCLASTPPKHVSQNAGNKNLISINGKSGGDWFIFETSNTVDPTTQPAKSGIGLANVKKRLDLIYPEKHFLSVETKDEVFRLTLKIKIK